MSKHTPAPWIIREPSESEHRTLIGSDGRNGGIYIAETKGPDNVANATLIAAAPEMYEALKALVAVCETHPAFRKPENVITMGRMNTARAAIAKAEGRT